MFGAFCDLSSKGRNICRVEEPPQQATCCAEKLRSLLALPNEFDVVMRFVSDDVWGGVGTCGEAAGLIADYFVHAWDQRNACKHNGAVLPPPSAPVGRGADGDVAMA
jgi:hypothetical protein